MAGTQRYSPARFSKAVAILLFVAMADSNVNGAAALAKGPDAYGTVFTFDFSSVPENLTETDERVTKISQQVVDGVPIQLIVTMGYDDDMEEPAIAVKFGCYEDENVSFDWPLKKPVFIAILGSNNTERHLGMSRPWELPGCEDPKDVDAWLPDSELRFRVTDLKDEGLFENGIIRYAIKAPGTVFMFNFYSALKTLTKAGGNFTKIAQEVVDGVPIQIVATLGYDDDWEEPAIAVKFGCYEDKNVSIDWPLKKRVRFVLLGFDNFVLRQGTFEPWHMPGCEDPTDVDAWLSDPEFRYGLTPLKESGFFDYDIIRFAIEVQK